MLAIHATMDNLTKFIFDGQTVTNIFTESKVRKKKGKQPIKRIKVASVTSPTTGNPSIDSMDLYELIARADIGQDVTRRKLYFQRLKALAADEAALRTAQILERRGRITQAKRQRRLETRGKVSGVFAESAELGDMTIGGTNNTTEHENVTEHAGEQEEMVTVGQSLHDTPDGGQTVYDLNKFFERPFSIYDATWNSGTEQNVALKVWDLWANKPAIRAKLSNYAYFKGDLNIKVAVSGTPFHYGRIMLSYQPYADFNECLLAYDRLLAATVPTTAAVLPPYKSYLSQAPGVEYIDIKENKPVVLKIPFISYKQKFRIWNSNNAVITNATPLHDFEEAGELRLVTLNKVAIANDDFDSQISINVYAWMTNVELGCITGTNMDITAESREIFTEARRRTGGASKSTAKRAVRNIERQAEDLEDQLSDDGGDDSWGGRWKSEEQQRSSNWNKSMENKPMYSGSGNFGSRFMSSIEKGVSEGHDEYQDPGPVAKIATAVSGVGESLSDIPVIGGFAKATTTIAKGIGKVASWFGWSRPAVLEPPIFVKNRPFSNGATTEGQETVYRITVDPKQELSVDPSPGGMDGKDELSILNISSRESFLTTFTWSDIDTAMSTVLWKSFVTPQLGTYCSTMPGQNSTDLIQPSALMYAAMPFNNWRGKIKFRFEIACSKFHRGKLLFRYEPNTAQYALIASSDAQLNQQNTTILDIQDGQNITFEVDWAQTRSWAVTPFSPGQGNSRQFGNDLPDVDVPYVSDIFSFYNNELNGVLEVRPLNELVQPTDTSPVYVNVYVSCDDLQVAAPTQYRMPIDRTTSFTESKEMEASQEVINPTNAKLDNIHLEHFGEKILSFRTMMKRYVTTHVYEHNTTVTGPGWWEVRGLHFEEPSLAPRSNFIPSGNALPGHIFEYLRYGFMGMRGSMRRRIIPNWGGNGSTTHQYTRVCLNEPDDPSAPAGGIGLYTQPGGTVDEIVGGSVSNFLATFNGTVTYHHDSNGGVEFETPFYSDNLFMFSFHTDQGIFVSTDDDLGINPYYHAGWNARFGTTFDGTETGTVMVDSAIGEDFTFLRFQGAPFYVE